MWVLETVAVAFGMYSALPVPRFDWNERNMRYALAAFPLVGVALGLAWWGACALPLPPMVRGAALCALPTFVTGGIHLDGYADVSDALASHAAPERKREILRDPHVGAFAVIRLCVYFVAYFALCCSVEPTPALVRCMGLGFVLSRTLSGGVLTTLPVAPGSSMAKAFADAADKGRVRAILLALGGGCFAGLFLCGGWAALLAPLLACATVTWRCVRVVKRDFDGTSGDLLGWFLVKLEFWLLAALYAAQMGGLLP